MLYTRRFEIKKLQTVWDVVDWKSFFPKSKRWIPMGNKALSHRCRSKFRLSTKKRGSWQFKCFQILTKRQPLLLVYCGMRLGLVMLLESPFVSEVVFSWLLTIDFCFQNLQPDKRSWNLKTTSFSLIFSVKHSKESLSSKKLLPCLVSSWIIRLDEKFERISIIAFLV